MEQEQKKKKKRMSLIVFGANQKDIETELNMLSKKLIKIFKHHIGRDNSISSYDLFSELFGKLPEEVDLFHRTYLWDIVKLLLQKLRSSETLFIVSNASKHFVLQSSKECKSFERKIDRAIKSLENTKTKARNWVARESWRNF